MIDMFFKPYYLFNIFHHPDFFCSVFGMSLVWGCSWHVVALVSLSAALFVISACPAHLSEPRPATNPLPIDCPDCNSLATSSAAFGNASASILTERWRGYICQVPRLCRNEIGYKGVMPRWHVCQHHERHKIQTERVSLFKLLKSSQVYSTALRTLTKDAYKNVS